MWWEKGRSQKEKECGNRKKFEKREKRKREGKEQAREKKQATGLNEGMLVKRLREEKKMNERKSGRNRDKNKRKFWYKWRKENW